MHWLRLALCALLTASTWHTSTSLRAAPVEVSKRQGSAKRVTPADVSSSNHSASGRDSKLHTATGGEPAASSEDAHKALLARQKVVAQADGSSSAMTPHLSSWWSTFLSAEHVPVAQHFEPRKLQVITFVAVVIAILLWSVCCYLNCSFTGRETVTLPLAKRLARPRSSSEDFRKASETGADPDLVTGDEHLECSRLARSATGPVFQQRQSGTVDTCFENCHLAVRWLSHGRMWLASSLAIWSDEDAYIKGHAPLTAIFLRTISSAHAENCHGKPCVSLRYTHAGIDKKFNVFFSSAKAARSFREDLNSLLKNIDSFTQRGNASKKDSRKSKSQYCALV